MKLDKLLLEEFRERIFDDHKTEIDYEKSWAIFNGLIVSYLKAKGDYSKTKEETLKDGVRKVILSLPKYELGFGKQYQLNKEDKAYFQHCPKELVDGLNYSKINEKTVMELAQKVVEFSAENGVKEDYKLRIADIGVSRASMAEFEEMNNTMNKMYDTILETRGEDGLKIALSYYSGLAEKAVKDEIDFHADNANYIVKFFSGILHHSREEEYEGAISLA